MVVAEIEISDPATKRAIAKGFPRKLTGLEDPIHHVEINVADMGKSSRFYGEMLEWLGFKKTLDEQDVVGWRKGKSRMFLVRCSQKFLHHGFHRKHVGLNHIAFRATSRNMVDEFHNQYLLPRKITVLYGGPKERPEYRPRYYSVYFEDLDRIKLELVFTPP